MKRLFLVLLFILWGAFLLFFLYPFLHEAGHALFAVLCGERVVSFQVFPVPSVLTISEDLKKQAFVSSGGLLFPMVVGLALSGLKGLLRLGNAMLQIVVSVSFFIELITAVQYYLGDPVPNQDVTLFIQATGCSVWEVGIPLFLLMVLSAAILRLGDPMEELETIWEQVQ